VLSVQMDAWTDERISQMDAGGNETFSTFLASRGIGKDWEMRKKYSTKQAYFYSATLRRRSKGKPVAHDPVLIARKASMECLGPNLKKSMTDLNGVVLPSKDDESSESDSDSDSGTSTSSNTTTDSDSSSEVPVDPGNYNVEYGGDALGPDRLPGESFDAYVQRQARVRPLKSKSLRRSSMLKSVTSVGDSNGSSSHRFSVMGMLGFFGVQEDDAQAGEELRKRYARGSIISQ
jgi:hypothetical protein